MSKREGEKGAAGEREVAKILTSSGFDCARNARNGISTDDLAHAIPGVHIEVKRRERLNVSEAMQQATRDAGERSPVVVHRRSHEPWLATVRLDDLLTWWD